MGNKQSTRGASSSSSSSSLLSANGKKNQRVNHDIKSHLASSTSSAHPSNESYHDSNTNHKPSVATKDIDTLTEMLGDMPANFKTGGTIPTPEEKNQPQADEIDRFDVFLKWLDDGKCNYADLYLHYYDEDYRGIHIKQDLPARKVILSIPKTHIMTTDMAKRSKVGRQLRKPGLYLSCTDSYLAMYLLAERSNPSSFWRPFIDILPKKYSTMPIFFTDDELTWLKGSFALDKIATRKRELRREYDEIVNHVEDFKRFTYEDFVWARVVIITRQFGMRLDGRDTDGLVPMADMLNHKRPNETDWDYSDAKGCFTITTVKDMRKGEQVFDSYGRKCNSRFFVNYGFSLVENEDNQIAIKVCVPVDVEMYADKIRLLGTTTKSAQIPRQYSFKGTKDILSLLRIAFASEQQMKAWRGEGRRGYLHVNTRDVPPISLQNECRALTSLAQTCTAYLARFDTTLAEDEKLLSGLEPEAEKALTRNQRNAVLMRRGEKQVCHHYIQLARDTLKLCDLAPQDVKRQVEVENLLFQSAFAREYYVLAVEPLLGIK